MNIFDNSEKNIESTSESDIESGLKLKIPKRVWDMYMNGNEIENDINIDNGLNVNDEVNVYMNIDEDEDEDTVDEEHVTKHSKALWRGCHCYSIYNPTGLISEAY